MPTLFQSTSSSSARIVGKAGLAVEIIPAAL